MQALILSDDPSTHHRLSQCLIKRGFQVVNSESVMMATAHVRAWIFDLVVMTEHVNGCLTHRVALSAEKRAPFVKTVLLSDRTDEEVDELYDLLPSLVSIVSPSLASGLIGQIALANVAGSARVLDATSGEPAHMPHFISRRASEERLLAG